MIHILTKLILIFLSFSFPFLYFLYNQTHQNNQRRRSQSSNPKITSRNQRRRFRITHQTHFSILNPQTQKSHQNPNFKSSNPEITKPTKEISDQTKNKYKEEDKNRNGERRVLALSWRLERESLRSSALGFRSRDRGKNV